MIALRITRALAITGLFAIAPVLHAQAPGALSSFAPATRGTIEQIIDAARTARLPVEPLYDKAAEGKLKDAPDSAIVAAVRALAKRLAEARSGLGPQRSASALTEAATALRVGVPMATLQRLAASASTSPHADADLTVALMTLADLMRQRASVDAAATAVASLLERRATDDQYARLRLSVEADVVAGMAPETAIRQRAATIVKTLPPPPRPPRSGGPPTADPPR